MPDSIRPPLFLGWNQTPPGKEDIVRIAVTTPTGHVGSHVVAMLVRAGVRPLVLARDPDRL